PPMVRAGREGELPLSYAQQRLWFIHQLEPASAAYNIPCAVRMRGELEIAALEKSLEEIARRHEALRTRFEARGGRPVQVMDEPADAKVAMWDLSQLEEEEREGRAGELVKEEAGRPFDLERGPMWRVSLARLGEGDHVLLLIMHHVVSDGWS